MFKEVWFKVLLTIVGIATTGSCGYLTAKIKEYKAKIKSKEDNEKLQNIALMTLLQSQITNVFFAYNSKKKIPDYLYKNTTNAFKVYKELGGNDYVEALMKQMSAWELVRTDIL